MRTTSVVRERAHLMPVLFGVVRNDVEPDDIVVRVRLGAIIAGRA